MLKQIIARIRSRWLLARLHQLTRRRRAEEGRLARLDGPPSFASADPVAAHSAHIAAVLDARAADADALRGAADDLDRLWQADEARGFRDGGGGAEYQRLSRAPRLRAMADKIDPPADASEFRFFIEGDSPVAS